MDRAFQFRETVDDHGSIFMVIHNGKDIYTCRDGYFAATLADCLNRFASFPRPSLFKGAQGEEILQLRECLSELDAACQALGSVALPVWNYNPPEYLRQAWEDLSSVLAKISARQARG